MDAHGMIEQAQLHASRLVERHQGLLEANSALGVKTRAELGRDADQNEAALDHVELLVRSSIEAIEARAVCSVKEKSIAQHDDATAALRVIAYKVSHDGYSALAKLAEHKTTPPCDLLASVDHARKELRMSGLRVIELEAERDAVAAMDKRVAAMAGENEALAIKLKAADKLILELGQEFEVVESECAFLYNDQEDRSKSASCTAEHKTAEADYYTGDLIPELKAKIADMDVRRKQTQYELDCMREYVSGSIRR